MPTKSYVNFDLLLNQAGEGYQVHVIDSPAGQASQTFSLPFSALELENFILKIGQNRGGVRSLHLETVDVPSVKKLGGALYDCIFGGAVAERFRSSLALARHEGQGLRIRLRLSGAPALTDIPWELMFDAANNNYVGLSVNTPIVRQLDLATQPDTRQAVGALQVLVMIASPANYPPLDVEREWERINSATQGLQAQGRLVLTRVEPSLAALQQQLRKGEYHIFHYIGHGGFDRSSNDGVLVLEDEQKKGHLVSGQYLGAILYDQATIQLALLNACSGGRTSVTDPFAGVGQSLLQKGIPAVIAMQFEITDEAAITFSHEFYAALADGYPVDAAVAEARKMIYAKANQLEWATPVLYMSTDNGGILREPKPGEAPAREAPQPAPQAETQGTRKAKPATSGKPFAVVGILLQRFGWKGVAAAVTVLACAIVWLVWPSPDDVTPAPDEATSTSSAAKTVTQPAIQPNGSAATNTENKTDSEARVELVTPRTSVTSNEINVETDGFQALLANEPDKESVRKFLSDRLDLTKFVFEKRWVGEITILPNFEIAGITFDYVVVRVEGPYSNTGDHVTYVRLFSPTDNPVSEAVSSEQDRIDRFLQRKQDSPSRRRAIEQVRSALDQRDDFRGHMVGSGFFRESAVIVAGRREATTKSEIKDLWSNNETFGVQIITYDSFAEELKSVEHSQPVVRYGVWSD